MGQPPGARPSQPICWQGAGYFCTFLRADDLFCFAPKSLASAGIQTDFLTRI